jgi:hypothetical protein
MARAVEWPNRYFAFLRRLRAEGRSNMYGAVPYLAAAFGIDRNESFRIICEWVDAQESLAGNPAVPRTSVPAERAPAPTLFDPLPAAEPAAVARPAAGKAAARKPVRQRKRAPATPRKRGRRKPPHSSDSRAA